MEKEFTFIFEYEPKVTDLMEKEEAVILNNGQKERKVKPKRNRAIRRKNNFKKVKRKRIIALQGNSYNPFKGYVEYEEIEGKWMPTGKYVKYVGKSNGQRYLKRKTNKNLRKKVINEDDGKRKGNSYRRESGVDYKWELY